ncbi:uncharacterized protein [Fopius arisanus]|uniref:Uncharacterized protein isoform X2 n=1 Tax=Fopius arisanus TaxID=64838 RepID=A0A9R1U509_9HYME|nr:PREDICTED: uncharacterized protein LOC105269893 isoform X2 [Fopius arisanus]
MDNFRIKQNAEMRKYNLSLKNRLHNNPLKPVKSRKNQRISDTSDPSDSQNFKLRVSDSFCVENSDEEAKSSRMKMNNNVGRAKNNEIIIISDSSDGEEIPETQTFSWQSSPRRKIKENSLKDSIEVSDEDAEIFTGSLTRGQSTGSEGKSRSQRSVRYSSDETNFELKFEENDVESVIDSSYTTPARKLISMTGQVNSRIESRTATNISERSAKPSEVLLNSNKKLETPGSVKLSQCTTPLSKRTVKDIIKVIRSKRIDSPAVSEQNHIVDETDSDSVVTDEDPDSKVTHPAFINETDSEASLDPKPSKTHVTRFLNPNYRDPDALSEEKKKDISRWLMNNSSNDRSDDSMSNISASNRQSSTSSGHRSLERLEMNYETPNNRQKFREKFNTPKVLNPLADIPRETPRQTLIDDYLRKPKSSSKSETYTPITIKAKTVAVSPAVDTPKSNFDDCADILDKLYGETWRQHAGGVPITEPRRQVVLKDRGVQTECIRKPKKLLQSEHSSKEEGYQNFIRDIKPGLNSTRKQPIKYKTRDSFIIYSSESEESTGDTTYMTALTNPRISESKNIRRETPMSLNTKKAIEICDSDSEDGTPVINVNNRRKLVFSDDDNDNSSGTSEYDPEEVVPPKFELPKNTRPLVNKLRIPAKTFLPSSAAIRRREKKSFLASLSGIVPLEECHQDAVEYRSNFKKTRAELVKVLYKIFNEKIFDNKLPPDMLIEWNVRMRGTAGFCYNKRIKSVIGIKRSSRIALSTKVIDTADRLRDTLIHEMCHAATWIIDELDDGHGAHWKAWTRKCLKVFPELPPIKVCHDYTITTKFTYRCTQCGYSIGRHSKSLDVQKKRCGHCFGRFELLLNRVTRSGTMQQTPHNKQPSGFALFVKENFSVVKKERQVVRLDCALEFFNSK